MLKQSVSLALEPFAKGQGVLYLITRNYITSNHLLQQAQTQKLSEWQNAKPMSEIPSPPKQPLIGHLSLMTKNAKSLHIFHDELRKKYGNIVLLSVPGRDLVCIYGPEEARVLFSNDGKNPLQGGFEPITFYRYDNFYI